MAKKRKRKNGLPRVTVLALSAAELVRFCESMERGVALVGQVAALVGRLHEAVNRLEARSGAARKANATRARRAAETAEDVGPQEPWTAPPALHPDPQPVSEPIPHVDGQAAAPLFHEQG